MYDNCELGRGNKSNFYLCSSKGMRMPTKNEASAWSSSGVPSCGGTTWTGTSHSNGNGGYCYWNGTSGNCTDDRDGASDLHYLRCVR